MMNDNNQKIINLSSDEQGSRRASRSASISDIEAPSIPLFSMQSINISQEADQIADALNSKKTCRQCGKNNTEDDRSNIKIPLHLRGLLKQNIQNFGSEYYKQPDNIMINKLIDLDYISPCQCKRDKTYAHQECMKLYLLAKDKISVPNLFCDMCGTEYAFQFNRNYMIDCSFSRESVKSNLRDSLILIILCIIFFILHKVINQEYKFTNKTDYSKNFAKFLSAILIVLLTIVAILFIISLFECIIFRDTKDWGIFCYLTEIAYHKEMSEEFRESQLSIIKKEFWKNFEISNFQLPQWLKTYYKKEELNRKHKRKHKNQKDKICKINKKNKEICTDNEEIDRMISSIEKNDNSYNINNQEQNKFDLNNIKYYHPQTDEILKCHYRNVNNKYESSGDDNISNYYNSKKD